MNDWGAMMSQAVAPLLGVLVVGACLHGARALDNGLAITPPMGYNTWNAFRCDIDDQSVRANVDLMIQLGLRDAGYVHFNLDDCWQLDTRSKDGELQPNTTRFPNGMKELADYVHSQGMQFGIYSDAGTQTCEGKAGSLGFEEVDAATFASYGVDYLKYDNCHSPPLDKMDVRDRYAAMRDALNKTGRPIIFSMCEWGVNEPNRWGPSTGNLWRTANDISGEWDSVLRSLDNQIGLAMYAGPGAWNDPDMLEVGNPGHYGQLPIYRQQAHFALWAIMKAPLLIGTDLRQIAPESLTILLAKEVIAINQDPLGVAGDLIFQQGTKQILAAPLKGGSRAVAFFHRQYFGDNTNMTVTWSMLGYPDNLAVMVRDLHARADLGVHVGYFVASVPRDSVVLVKLTPSVDARLPVGIPGRLRWGSDNIVRRLDTRRPEQLQVSMHATPLELEHFDSWRPWSHGFFGSKEEPF